MIVAVWIIAIVVCAILTTINIPSRFDEPVMGAIVTIILYVIVFAIAGAITRSITSSRNAEKARLQEQEDKAEGIVRGTCEHNGVMGTLECANSFVRFTSVTGRQDVFQIEDGIKVSLNNDQVCVIDEKQEEHVFKVNNAELFRDKIDYTYKRSQQFTNHINTIVSEPIKSTPLEETGNQVIRQETKKTENDNQATKVSGKWIDLFESLKTSSQQPSAPIKDNTTSPRSSIPLETINHVLSDSDTKKSKDNESEKLFCRKCGAQIPSDSEFCNHCGTRVVKM